MNQAIINVVFFSIISTQISSIECDICTKSVILKNYGHRTFTRYVRQTYKGDCPDVCVETKVVKDVRLVPKTMIEVKKFCCDGYIANTSSKTLQCDPLCSPPCQNGYCSEPGRCTCEEGYISSPKTRHTCVPYCNSTCEHGNCVHPNYCFCDIGYMNQNNTCFPICHEPCVNGICTAPNTCECLPGFNKSLYIGESYDNICRPHCSNCTNGTCVAPEKCVCDVGWYRNEKEAVCLPRCDHGCGYGVCVGPNKCECREKYIKSENGSCVPYCSSGCPNGICVSTEKCICNVGWFKSEPNGTCQPICRNGCGNGLCVAPDVCKCFTNYTTSEDGSCVPFCSTGCPHGKCVEPGHCECDSGWHKNDTDCKPICSIACGNGTCVAPNVCQCFTGYAIAVKTLGTENGALCAPKCHNCYGKCVSPKICECEKPFIAKAVAADGTGCDCFENCAEGAKKCDRTECVYQKALKPLVTSSDMASIEDDATLYDEITDYELNHTITDVSKAYKKSRVIRNPKSAGWIHSIYIAVGIILIIIILIWKRRIISNYFARGEYYLEDDNIAEISETICDEDVTFSDLLDRLGGHTYTKT